MNFNYLILYSLILVLFICVIILFVKNNNNQNTDISNELTLDNLKVKNLEIEENLISPNIQTNNIYSLDKDNPYKPIKINNSLDITKDKTTLTTTHINTKGFNSVVGYFKHLRIDNGYIKQFVNDETITVEDFYNKTNEDKINENKNN